MQRASQANRLHPNRLVAILSVATAVIVCACGVVIIWVLNVSATSLDHTKETGELRLLRSVIKTQENALAKAVGDYAAWTELYTYLQGPREHQWEVENLGPYLAKVFDVDHVFIVSRDGKIPYAYSTGATQSLLSPTVRHALGEAARSAFAAARPEKQIAVSGIVELGNVPSLLAAATVRTSAITGRPGFVLVETRALNRQYLASIEQDYSLVGLHTERDHGIGLPLVAPDGKRSGFALVWRTAHVGLQLFDRVLPTVILLGSVATLTFLGLIFLWWRVTNFIRTNEARALRAVADANKARAQAAEETSKSKSAFIANMSHELRTPLNAIIGFSEFIVSEVQGPIGVKKYREYAIDIRDSGYHLLNLVNDILQTSKIEAGKFEPRIENVPVADAIHQSVRMTEVLAEKRGIRLHIENDVPNAIVFADAQALHQVLVNILSNAIKFSHDNGVVRIERKLLGTMCEISISDWGCGIPQETLKDIGKPFVQAEGVYSRKHQGTGLGLTICFQLIEAMHGSIAVSSAEGYGTTVRIRLPSTPVPDMLTEDVA